MDSTDCFESLKARLGLLRITISVEGAERIIQLEAVNADLLAVLKLGVEAWMDIHELTEIANHPAHWVNRARKAIAKAEAK